jgi:hypothetical protein
MATLRRVVGVKLFLASIRLINGPLEAFVVIRETRRKFQYTASEATVWKKQA